MNIIVKNSVRKLLQVFVGLSVCLPAFDCLDLSYDFVFFHTHLIIPCLEDFLL